MKRTIFENLDIKKEVPTMLPIQTLTVGRYLVNASKKAEYHRLSLKRIPMRPESANPQNLKNIYPEV